MDGENLYSSNIDDNLFDDENGQGGNGGNQGNQGGGNQPAQGGNNGNPNNNNGGNRANAQQQQHVEDGEIIDAMRNGLSMRFDNLDDRNNGNNDGNQPSGLIINDDDDAISYLLKKNQIDPSKIAISGEHGESEEISFNQLSRDEQIDILKSILNDGNQGNQGGYNEDLTEDEIDLISSIRRNRMDVTSFLEELRRGAIQEYIDNNTGEYSYQNMSDDDLFINDYKTRFPDTTEQECIDALNALKSNERAFKRTVDGIREAYKKQEDIIRENDIKDRQEREMQRLKNEETLVVNTVNKYSNMKIGELSATLSDQDKEDIASFILDSDVSGKRYLQTAINDPDTLFQMAWWATKGRDAINQMQRYYKQQISEKQVASYKKGYDDAKNGKNMSFVVQQKGNRMNGNKHSRIPSLADLDEGLE